MKKITESEMLRKAAAYCSAAERCEQEVRKKIEASGLPNEAAQRIIDRLYQERFLDEERYARFFVNDKLRFNKWGRVKIGYELYRKGIPVSIREEALAAIDEGMYRTTLQDLLRAKLRLTKGKDKRDLFNKLLRYAASKGFESRAAIDCLRKLTETNDQDFDEDEYDLDDME